MKTGFIDWTDDRLNLYIFEKESGQFKCTDSSSMPMEGELNTEILKSLPLSSCDNIFLSIPADLLTLREQSFPFSDKDKIRDTIPYELEGILLGNISDYSIDHIVTEQHDTGCKVLAVCMEKKRLREIIDMFASAGLEPRVVTSLDLRLSAGRSDLLLEETVTDPDIRAEAASEEIMHPSVNLRQAELSYMGDVVKFLKNLRVTGVLVLILLLVLAANSTLKLITLNKEHKMLTNEIQDVYHRVFPEDKKIIDAERQFKGNLNMLMKKKAALGGIPVLDILREIALKKTGNITLHEFTADGKNILLKGTAGSFEDVEALKDTLTSAFKDVKVTDSGATADKKINFTIVMRDRTA